MEQPNRIDDLMRQRLRQTEVRPPAFVWPNVERALRRRKRRFFFLWFLAGGLATGMLATGLWALWNRSETSGGAATQPAAYSKPVAAVPETVTIPKPAEPGETGISGAQAAIGETTIPLSEKYPAGSPATPAASSVRRSDTAPASRRTPVANNIEKKMHPGAGQADAQVQREIVEPGTTALTPAAEDPGLTPASVFAPLSMPVNLLNLPAHKTTLATVQTPPPAKTKRAPRKCYDFHTHPRAWLVDAYGGPSWSNKGLKSPDSELQDYLLDRNQTETRTWGYNAGIRASYLFAGNFLLRTGLHLDHFEEQFEYIDPDFIRYNITITQQFINGQWVSVTDTIGIEYGTNYLKTYNRYALLDIPLQAALELRSGATGVSLNLGGSVNILFEKRGSILDTTGKPASFTPGSGQNEVFRTSLGMSLMGSIQWFYHLNPRTRVFIEPYYRHILDPVTRPELPYEQTYGVGGVRLGLTRIFD